MEHAIRQDDRVREAKATTIRELDLMHQAINDNQLKKALFHKKLANAAIDEMMLSNEMNDKKDRLQSNQANLEGSSLKTNRIVSLALFISVN